MPDGWLGFLLGTTLWYGISEKTTTDVTAFEATMTELIHVLYHVTNHANATSKAQHRQLTGADLYENIYGTGKTLPPIYMDPDRQSSTLPKVKPLKGKYHLMLSYAWAQQDAIKQVRQALDALGFVVWFDLEQMSGSTTDAMANAVESSEAIIYCMYVLKKYSSVASVLVRVPLLFCA